MIGEKPTTRAERFLASFKVPYAPGVLKAVGVRNGKPAGESVLRTAGEAVQLKLTADRVALNANGQDLSFVTVEVVDKGGLPRPDASHEVTFSLSGPGTIAAVGSANMFSEEPYQGTQRKLFNGKALVVVRTTRTAGAIRLTAGASGLKPATLAITSRPGSAILVV